jgi:hypothetical protein
MLPYRSIKSLYPLATAEGEGVGTAYEYFAKRLVLGSWIARRPRPNSLLIAGLPEKYGASLDFLLLAREMDVPEVVVIDDRPPALERNRQSLLSAQAVGQLTPMAPHYVLAADLSRMEELTGEFDLCVGSEVLQRLDAFGREQYLARVGRLARAVALFAPNADNGHHTTLSGLSGLRKDEMRSLAGSAATPQNIGYIDMPPFPPGMTRSPSQRMQASSGRLEAFAMSGLGWYARLESWFPSSWRRSHSHIVYALLERGTP